MLKAAQFSFWCVRARKPPASLWSAPDSSFMGQTHLTYPSIVQECAVKCIFQESELPSLNSQVWKLVTILHANLYK